eukprot:5323305-Pyramimonas_sp.AAC.2
MSSTVKKSSAPTTTSAMTRPTWHKGRSKVTTHRRTPNDKRRNVRSDRCNLLPAGEEVPALRALT